MDDPHEQVQRAAAIALYTLEKPSPKVLCYAMVLNTNMKDYALGLRKNATTHQVTTILTTSENVLFPQLITPLNTGG